MTSRTLFPLSDLWQIADRCICSGELKATKIGSYANLESKAITQCEDCGALWKVTVMKERFDLQNEHCNSTESSVEPIWEGIECPVCPQTFTESSWNSRHSEGLFEVHEACCRSPFCLDLPDSMDDPNNSSVQ